MDRDAGVVQRKGQAVVVGIRAKERAVSAAHQRVHAADALRLLADLIAIREHGFFVRNRDVDAAPVATFKKAGDVRRLHLKKIVVVISDLRVDLRRKAVAERAPEESVAHSSISTFL